jgi:putative transposase
VPASEMSEVAEDLKAIFKVRRQKTARALAKEFVKLYGSRFAKAISVFEAGINDALSYLSFPGSHHARLRTTNMLERLFREVRALLEKDEPFRARSPQLSAVGNQIADC